MTSMSRGKEIGLQGLLFIQSDDIMMMRLYVVFDQHSDNSCSHFSGSMATQASVSLPLLPLHLCGSFRTPISPPTVYSEKSCFRPPMETLSLSKLLNTIPTSHENIGSSPVVSFYFH